MCVWSGRYTGGAVQAARMPDRNSGHDPRSPRRMGSRAEPCHQKASYPLQPGEVLLLLLFTWHVPQHQVLVSTEGVLAGEQ